MNSWILVANSSEAHLYESENLRSKDLSLIKEFKHPASREKNLDLTTDRPGHYKTSHSARGSYEKGNPKHDEAEIFARQLVDILRNGNHKHDYVQLIIITAPNFYGLLNKYIDFSVDNFKHIPKDYTKYSVQKLAEYLHQHLFVF